MVPYLDDLKRHVQLREEDVLHLRALGQDLQGHLEVVMDRFYERLFRDPKARAVFKGGQAQMDHQRVMLVQWLSDLFCGVYDQIYAEKRMVIGRAHVRVGLPQHYMFIAMEMIWQELRRLIRSLDVRDFDAKMVALHKLLTLEITIMLESYKESYSSQVRQEERSVAEEKLTRSEHLAEIGQLAASLAHEIKNPLAGISGAIQVIRDGMRDEDPHRPIIREILGQINRLDAAVKDLLIFARPKPPTKIACDLNLAISRVVKLLRGTSAFRRVQVRFEAADGLPHVVADEGQIEQLVINLLVNAAHACEQGGTIDVRLSRRDDQVRLMVADTGKGMDEATRQRAFEPFFTTKARGTGLGLSICRKIVDAHHGTITLNSQADVGTQVFVDLPSERAEDRVIDRASGI